MRSYIILDSLRNLQEKIKAEIAHLDKDLGRDIESELLEIIQEAHRISISSDPPKATSDRIKALKEKERKAKIFSTTFNRGKSMDRKFDLEYALGELNTFFYRNSEEHQNFLKDRT